MLGTIIGMFGPCLVVNDFNNYFLTNGIINSVNYIIGLIILAFLVHFDMVILTDPVAFKSSPGNFYSLYSIEFYQLNLPFMISATLISFLWAISFVSLIFLHQCLDPVKKFQYSKKIFKCLIYIILIFFIFPTFVLTLVLLLATLLMILPIIFLSIIMWDFTISLLSKCEKSFKKVKCLNKIYDYYKVEKPR